MFNLCLFITWSSVLASIATNCYAAPSPGLYEVDILFPRDGGTYDPVALMPVVFGVQNPSLGYNLAASLNWIFYESGGSKLYSPHGTGSTINLYNLSSPIPDPYLASVVIDTIYGVEGVWEIQWQMAVYNCSDQYYNSYLNADHYNTITFTTKNGSTTPDLAAAMAPTTCASTGNITFDVTSFDTNWDEHQDPGNEYCPIIFSNSTATANPCAVTIAASAASSISASVTASQCSQASALGTSYPGLSCDNSSDQSTSSSSAIDSFPHLSVGAAALTVLMGLICFL